MDLHYRQEITVGALVLVGVLIFVLGGMWLSGKPLFGGDQEVLVLFNDVGTLKPGSKVRVSGVEKGSVKEIELLAVDRVLVSLDISKTLPLHQDATAQIVAIGLVGDVQINFNPGTAPDPLTATDTLRGTVAQGLMDPEGPLLTETQATLRALQQIASKQLSEDIHGTLTSLQRLANTYSNTRSGPVAEITTTMGSLQALSARIDSTLQSPSVDQAFVAVDSMSVKMGRLTEQFAVTGARLDSLLSRINRGEGSLGLLATDTAMYAQLTGLSASLRAFVDDLRRNPGKINVQVKLF
jgi:phospholipid/cholesterol/gamma-HCH transport system substrate-binding protein